LTALAALLPGPAEAAVFAGAVFVLNATPGVDFLLTVSRTLQGGARAGIAAAAGIMSGCVVHALAAAFGLAALLAVHPQAFLLIQWAGAAYLMWLGLGMLRQAWRDGGDAAVATAPAAARPWFTDFRVGLLTNVLNPKVALFFLAFLLMGAWFVLQGALFLLVLVAVAARLKSLQASPLVRRALGAVGGLLFIVLAIRILRSRPLTA
jgi:threonine/homoserine/homoserine lactone efflux protein